MQIMYLFLLYQYSQGNFKETSFYLKSLSAADPKLSQKTAFYSFALFALKYYSRDKILESKIFFCFELLFFSKKTPLPFLKFLMMSSAV